MSDSFTRRIAPRWVRILRLVTLYLITCYAAAGPAHGAPDPDPAAAADAAPATVDATTLTHKVLCGYQGWFRCPNDGTPDGWRHWSRSSRRIVASTVTVEMWPDMSEYTDAERYPVPDFIYPNGQPATLFSSTNKQTVERHFQWMRTYGIDGVFSQRFLVNIGNPSFDDVLSHVRTSAARTGRVYALCYDLSGAPTDKLVDMITSDWKRLVDQDKITQDDRYLHHNGKPVLVVWGFFADRFPPAVAHRIIDLFKADDRYSVTLVGGCQWQWRTIDNAEWARAFRRFDIISPWNVGHYAMKDGHRAAATHYWQDDINEARAHHMGYLPVLYPGFGWTNLKGKRTARDALDRRGGNFLWEQFVAASDLGIDMAYVAMFDEVDEATAIFKVTNTPPTQAPFQTYEGLPTDWYLRLTGRGTSVIRSGEKAPRELPIRVE